MIMERPGDLSGNTLNLPKRKESKYLIGRETAGELVRFLSGNTSEEQYAVGNKNLIESVYFEGPQMNCYRAHVNGEKNRFKIRYRTYGMSSSGFLELKTKNGGVTKKKRCPVAPASKVLDRTNLRDALSEHWLSHNDSTGLDLFGIIEYYNLHPLLRIRYRRRAFVLPGGELRFTVDENIKTTLYSPTNWEHVISPDLCVFEIKEMKFSDTAREVKTTIVEQFDLEKRKFSKYCTSVEVLGLVSKIYLE